MQRLLQLGILGFGLLQNRNAGIGVFHNDRKFQYSILSELAGLEDY
jgi:hypothetical protein